MVREKNAIAQRGYTLLELMTAMVVAVIVVAAAAPTFDNVLFNNRMTVSANEFTRFLQFARSEAVKARTAVQVGAKSGGTAWQSGWTVTVNGNTLKDGAALGYGQTLTGKAVVLATDMWTLDMNGATIDCAGSGRADAGAL